MGHDFEGGNEAIGVHELQISRRRAAQGRESFSFSSRAHQQTGQLITTWRLPSGRWESAATTSNLLISI